MPPLVRVRKFLPNILREPCNDLRTPFILALALQNVPANFPVQDD